MNPDKAFTMGAGAVVACVAVSVVLWWCGYLLVRWVFAG